jgi:outer membrane protein OmpA-like peptidoglycan-associated protein
MRPIPYRSARSAAPLALLSLLCLFQAAPAAVASAAVPPAPVAPGPAAAEGAEGADYAAFSSSSSPDDEAMPDSLKNPPIAPTNTLNGTRGLSQTPAAEALGSGRLVLGLSGPWYRQEKAFAGTPNRAADIFTGVATLAYGLAPSVDLFASLTGYSSLNYRSEEATGLGTFGGGAQITWPPLAGFPMSMALQAGVFSGLSRNPINENQADGYNYFETRTGTDFRGMLIQSVVFGPERMGFKAHLNEGLAWSGRETGALTLLAAGLQANLGPTALGVELHSRSRAQDVALLDDPFWITPSLQLRTGWNVNLTAGADIALSQDRNHSVAERSLEPWRLIGGIAFTLDTRWKGARDAKWAALKAERARQAALARGQSDPAERERLIAEAAAEAEAGRQARAALAACLAAGQNAQAAGQSTARATDADSPAPARRAVPDRHKRTPLEKRLLAGETVRLGSVPFKSGKAELLPRAQPYLNELARILVRYPNLRYELGGHADGSGNPEVNRILSQARAIAVKGYLAEREPSLEDRVGAVGYGDASPVADNGDRDGRWANRKPDLKVVNQAALAEYARPEEQPAARQAAQPATQPAARPAVRQASRPEAQPAAPSGTAMGPEEQ